MTYDPWRPTSHQAPSQASSSFHQYAASPWDVPRSSYAPPAPTERSYETSVSGGAPLGLRIPLFAQRKLEANGGKLATGAPPPLRMPNIRRKTPGEIPSPCPPSTSSAGSVSEWHLKTPGNMRYPMGPAETRQIDSAKYRNDIKIDINPWIPPRVEGAGKIKIAALTPLGTFTKVPTSDVRPLRTPRRMPVPSETHDTAPDPIMTTPIYLDLTPSHERAYTHVADHMRSIAQATTQAHVGLKNELQPILNVKGKVTAKVFEQALQIYENNQVYYQEQIEVDDGDIGQIIRDLTELEFWFIQIIEPKPPRAEIDSWRIREQNKLRTGTSGYCDPDLRQYIHPLTPAVRGFIVGQHTRLGV